MGIFGTEERRDRGFKKVIFVSRQRIVGRTNGSSAYLLDLASAIQGAGLIPILLQPSPSLFGRIPVLRLFNDMDIFSEHHVRGAVRIGSHLVALDPNIWLAAAHGVLAKFAAKAGLQFKWLKDQKAPYSIAVPWTREDKEFVTSHTDDGAIIIADYVFQTMAFENLGAKATATATIMHDLFSQRAAMASENQIDDSVIALSRDEEVSLLGKADMVIAIQQTEADFVKEHLPEQSVLTIPMSYKTVKQPYPGNAKEILFVGSNTEPNVLGLKWFFKECWPDILKAVPDARVRIHNQNMTTAANAHADRKTFGHLS